MCNKSLPTAGRGISEVRWSLPRSLAHSPRRRWNSSLKELQRNHSCSSAAGLPALLELFFSSFLLFAELTLEQSVENANICLRQAANTLTITEESLDHFIGLVRNNDRTATFGAAFLLQTENCGRFNRKAQQRCHWPASRRLASGPELYLKRKKKTTEQTNTGAMSWQCGHQPKDKRFKNTLLKEMPWI